MGVNSEVRTVGRARDSSQEDVSYVMSFRTRSVGAEPGLILVENLFEELKAKVGN